MAAMVGQREVSWRHPSRVIFDLIPICADALTPNRSLRAP
jgi:hypothetical protein